MQSIVQNHDYIGVIKRGNSNDFEGKYLVYISELMSDAEHQPIWVKNEIVGNRFSRWLNVDSKVIQTSGSYFPLYEGMVVNVRFRGYSLESGYITNVVSDIPLVDKAERRDSFYLINKTLNNSWIYQDDARSETHIMQSGGKSNIVLDEHSVTLQVGGETKRAGFEVSDTGIRLEFGNSSLYLDAKGISFKIGDTIFVMSESGAIFKSPGNLEMEADKSLRFKGNKVETSASEKYSINANIVQMTGNQMLSLNGNVVNLNSLTHTNIESQAHVQIKSLGKVKLSSSIMDITSLTNMNIDSPVNTITGQTMNIDGTSLNLSGASVAMDGIISHGLGIAKSTNSAMKAANLTLGLSTDAANLALVTSIGNSDVVSGVVNSSMVQAIPGTASPVGEILKPQIVYAKVGNSVKEKLSYILSSNDIYNNIVNDQFTNLRNTHDIYI